MINLVGQQLTKTLIHVGNLLYVYCGLRDNIIDFYNFKAWDEVFLSFYIQ
jgi:hypothetical protein